MIRNNSRLIDHIPAFGMTIIRSLFRVPEQYKNNGNNNRDNDAIRAH